MTCYVSYLFYTLLVFLKDFIFILGVCVFCTTHMQPDCLWIIYMQFYGGRKRTPDHPGTGVTNGYGL